MQGWHDATQLILQILRDPALGGIGGLCSLIAIPLAIILSRKSEKSYTYIKKKSSKVSAVLPHMPLSILYY